MMRLDNTITAEVRRNREALLDRFDGDIHRMNEYFIAQQTINMSTGDCYETADEREARFAWNMRQRETQEQRIALLQVTAKETA